MSSTRCRLGFHHWVRAKRRADDDEGYTMCSRCGKEQTSGVVLSTFIFLAVAVAAVVIFWTVSALLGAIMMIGAVSGLGWAMGPAAFDRVARWLSIGR